MNFDENSGLVNVWVTQILNPDSPYTFKDTPPLYNLREEVEKKLIKLGYDIEEEENNE